MLWLILIISNIAIALLISKLISLKAYFPQCIATITHLFHLINFNLLEVVSYYFCFLHLDPYFHSSQDSCLMKTINILWLKFSGAGSGKGGSTCPITIWTGDQPPPSIYYWKIFCLSVCAIAFFELNWNFIISFFGSWFNCPWFNAQKDVIFPPLIYFPPPPPLPPIPPHHFSFTPITFQISHFFPVAR